MFDNFLFLYADKSMHEIEAELFQNIQNTRHEKYGPQTNPAIAERIRQEWHAMEGNENALDVAIADSSRPPPQLCQHCQRQRDPHVRYRQGPGPQFPGHYQQDLHPLAGSGSQGSSGSAVG